MRILESIKSAAEPKLIKESAKKIASNSIKSAKQIREKIIQEKQEREEKREKEKPRYYRQLILHKKDKQWISNSIVQDVNGNCEYRIVASLVKKKRILQFYNDSNQLIASASEEKPLFDFWGTERRTPFSISIYGSACGKATATTKGFHWRLLLSPHNWCTTETKHKCELVGPINEVIAETVGVIRKQQDTPILFYNRDDELLALVVLVLHASYNYDSFSKEFERYYLRSIPSE